MRQINSTCTESSHSSPNRETELMQEERAGKGKEKKRKGGREGKIKEKREEDKKGRVPLKTNLP